ncbi:hypothetical protein BKA66DRAFT_278080 [Pyrenochaeta sp. MPI-SDFR-AT-0127]|nr:hypothetical protein BKA66DRAFT_278080 [Pyrenochaeta sp. MPI-SDFR-AT-0127]
MSRYGDLVSANIAYTVRDPKHDEEKPYFVRYDTGGAIPDSNTSSVTQPVSIHNFRSKEGPENFQDYGFSVERLDRPWTETLFDELEDIKDVYYSEIQRLLQRKFPNASGVYVLEHGLRKRHAKFPTLEKDLKIEHMQPSTLAHIDCSLQFAIQTAKSAFNIPPGECRRVLSINLWKSLQGPGNDWPLALCDRRTMNQKLDTNVADIVYYNRFTENEVVYYNPEHEWYYVKDLQDDEIIMLVQKDSDDENGGGVAHTSFHNPLADEGTKPRSSIELRCYVVFA